MDLTRVTPIAFAACLLVIACGSASTDTPVEKPVTGQQLFNLHCRMCHGKDGKLGIGGAKDLTVSTLSKPEMAALVAQGKGAMAAYEGLLTPKQIDAVVDHVRSLQQ